jgi:hypothetical protein
MNKKIPKPNPNGGTHAGVAQVKSMDRPMPRVSSVFELGEALRDPPPVKPVEGTC